MNAAVFLFLVASFYNVLAVRFFLDLKHPEAAGHLVTVTSFHKGVCAGFKVADGHVLAGLNLAGVGVWKAPVGSRVVAVHVGHFHGLFLVSAHFADGSKVHFKAFWLFEELNGLAFENLHAALKAGHSHPCKLLFADFAKGHAAASPLWSAGGVCPFGHHHHAAHGAAHAGACAHGAAHASA